MITAEKNWATVKRGEAFKKLSSNPYNWVFSGAVSYGHGHCQLCETEIVWQYRLVEGGSDRALWVGSECVYWYYLVYAPNGLEAAIELLNKLTRGKRRELIDEKIEHFRALHPGIVDYLVGSTKRGYIDKTLLCSIFVDDEERNVMTIPVSKFRASLRRKGYLRTDELKVFYSGYIRARYGKTYYDKQIELTGGAVNEDRNDSSRSLGPS